MEAKKIKTVLSIAGSDPSGGAGIQADLKTFSYFGVYGMSVVTALTAQNSKSVKGIYDISPDFVRMQLESVAEGAEIDAVKTGMLASSRTAETVSEWIKASEVRFVVVDPVFVATSGTSLTEKGAVNVYINSLFPLSTVVTPNIPEAEALTNMKIESVDDMRKSAEIIFKSGPQYVLLKGGHLKGDITDVLFDGKEFYFFRSPRIESGSYHGTGCTLSSAVAAGLALGEDINTAVNRGIEYVRSTIKNYVFLGKEHFGLNHNF